LEETVNKIWETFGIFNTFEEADTKRKELLSVHKIVKVKRCGKDGSNFKIKFWNEPAPKEETKRKKSKKRKQK
tara:strand:+ start:860 stop:1078 length:219 start_codon:yes stop_codon:yes gene_type:complete